MTSIKLQAILLIATLVLVPVALVGIAGIVYYREVVRNNIWDNNLAEARAISALTTTYVDLAQTYLQSLADRPLVIKAVEERNVPFLSYNVQYATNQSDQIGSAFITDGSGTVLSSYPHAEIVGKSYLDRPYVGEVLGSARPVFSKVRKSEFTGKPTVYVGAPVVDANGTTIGALVGAVDMDQFRDYIARTQINRDQFVYVVNRSGRVMVHSNSSYMDNMTDFSTLPSVSNVIQGREGVLEQSFPFENDVRLVAYSPVAKYGWGVVVATPVGIAYRPIDESTRMFLAFIAALLMISLLVAVFIGKYLTDPILSIDRVTGMIPDGDPGKYKAWLPVHRKDEIGSLARSFMAMAGTIATDRARVVAARNQAEDARAHAESAREQAEEEKNRAELYVDIMGHDINNLNQTALTSLELMETDENLTAEQKELLGGALIAVKGSASVVDSVRTIQRATQEKIVMETLDINDLIQQCVTEAPRPKGRKVVIRYQPQKQLLVRGNTLIKAIFCNLVNNCVKHSVKDVTIDITVRQTEIRGKPFYQVAIEDDGPGISEDQKPLLFNRFQRGATKAKGKGLGLFIVRTLADRFGGFVAVENRVPGDYSQGSKFVVSLPGASPDD